MRGPQILVRSLTSANIGSKTSPNVWQYHSRSDRHSKIACWGILFDLLLESQRLRDHFADGTLAFGVNHEMRDFRQNRKKNLDLVVCTPGEPGKRRTLTDLVDKYGVELEAGDRSALASLPPIREAPVGTVRIALEAKACMTEHVKAIPRLHDELNSSHLTIHGSAAHAIAVGFAMVNISDEFVSSDRNKADMKLVPAVVTSHDQPRVARRVIEKLHELPRRSKSSDDGFDAFGIVVVDMKNDGGPVRLVTTPPAPQSRDIYEYGSMIRRTCDLYSARYR